MNDPTTLPAAIERFIQSAAAEEGPNCESGWFQQVEELLRSMATAEPRGPMIEQIKTALYTMDWDFFKTAAFKAWVEAAK